jgi:hypothetical protein
MGLDLNNPNDFLTATQGAFGATNALLSLFGGEREEWDIQEATYISNSSKEKGLDPVILHVFESKTNYAAGLDQIQDQGGRRKIAYEYPYKDGQTTDDIGRGAETFSLSIVIHGTNYLSAFKRIYRELNRPDPGVLVHPVRGPIEVAFDDYTIIHKSESRHAMAVSLNFIEHNFSIGDLQNIVDDTTVKSSLSKAMQLFTDIQNAIGAVQGAVGFAQNVKNKLLGALDAYSNSFAELTGKMNKSYNPNGSSSDIPSLVPVNEGGLLGDDGSREGDTFSVVQSPNDPFANVPLEDLDPDTIAAVTTLQLEKETNALRDNLSEILDIYKEGDNTELEFREDIVNLKASAVAMQEILEAGKASSRTKIVNYEVPKTMSIREAVYLNGVSLERLREVEILNPDIPSYNFIEQGTVLRIPK